MMEILSMLSVKDFVCLGAFAIFILGIFMSNYNKFSTLKTLANSVVLTLSGVVGALLMAFIESGSFGGISYFGAVFFIPAFMALYAKLTKQEVGSMLDFSAYGSCAMLAVMKIDCLVHGCCYGITFESTGFTFPSQILESINAIILMFVLIHLVRKKKYYAKIYPIYFIIYGITRFFFNSFRGDLHTYIGIIAQGHIWSVISIIIGIVWLVILKKNAEKLATKSTKKVKAKK